MTPSRWSTVLRRVTTEGPYINERMSVLVLTVVVLAGVSAVAFADKSVAPVSLAPLYFRKRQTKHMDEVFAAQAAGVRSATR